MYCHEAHDLLQQCLDGRPIESPEWLTHLRQCADCRALASAGRRLQEGLQRLPAPLPPPGLAERIAARVQLDRRRARNRTRRRWAISLALAAGLIVALTLRLDWRRTPNETTRQQTLPAPPTATAKQQRSHPDAPPSPTLRESAAELGEVFAALSNQTADETVGQTRRWVSNVPRPALPVVDLTTIGPSALPWREAGEGVSEGLEPVTTSARRAVNLFVRELPVKTVTN